MIISQSQLDISNKSYTNKDFAEVYTELLTYAEKLSYRFSPVSANETDPFIIMLKLAAFVCDKVNYNVDKNILERFMSSCTQETSMRELASMLGYYMHYYRSATTDVIFKHNTLTSSIVIPKFSILTNQHDIQFVTLSDATIDVKTKKSIAVTAVQGKLKTLSILGNNVIQLENLDLNNRVYFPESVVAENGVFINSDVEVDDWVRVENLNEQEYLSPIFYFGYDSTSRLPYIEFPSWISSIIGSGLTIKYLVSDGYAGNIAAASFVNVSRSAKDDEIDDAEIVVINNSATNNGADPESIEQSYSGFKRLVGTLDTLVTCRDYAAKIYDLVNSFGNNLVSNIVVSDRRTDLNYATQMLTIDNYGKTYKNIAAIDVAGDPQITPPDLCLYPYKPLTSYELLAIPDTNIGGYDDSYKFLGTVGTSAHTTIESALEGSKSISHQYKRLNQGDIIAIYIYLKLNAVITTNVKVSAVESQQILSKINQNLLKTYNSRTISIGNEIPFDEIYSTIIEADPRIKAVSLQEPLQYPAIAQLDYEDGDSDIGATLTRISRSDDSESDYESLFNFIALKNIVSGHISMFEYDTRFNYSFANKNDIIYEKICHVTTKAGISLTRDDKNSNKYIYTYTLDENEAIQIIGPKFNSFITYPYGVLYNLHLNNSSDLNSYRYIRKGYDYKLQENEYIMFAYADSDGSWTVDLYEGSNNSNDSDIVIINPNFNMRTTEDRLAEKTAHKILTDDLIPVKPEALKNETEIAFFMLSANDEVQCKKPVTDHLDSITYCYWVVNAADNCINWTKAGVHNNYIEYEYILRESEYFYYTDAASTALVEYGSGTKLVIRVNGETKNLDEDALSKQLETLKSKWKINDSDLINVADISSNGLNALAEHFMIMSFTSESPLDIYINEIKTLTSGDKISLSYGAYDPSDILEKDNDGNVIGYEISDNVFSPFKATTYIQKAVDVYKLDDNGNIIYEPADKLDENGDPIPKKDENGDPIPKKDENGDPIPGEFEHETYPAPSKITKDVEHKIYPEVTYVYDGADIESDTGAEESSETLLPDRSSLAPKYQWQIRGLLDLNCGPDQPQYLKNNNSIEFISHIDNNHSNCISTIELKKDENEVTCFKSNIDISMNGGDRVNLTYIDINTFDETYPTFISSTIDQTTKNFLNSFDGEFYLVTLPETSKEKTIESKTDINEDNSYKIINFYIPPVSRDIYAGFTVYVPENIGSGFVKLTIPEDELGICLSKICDFDATNNTKKTVTLHKGVNNIIAYVPINDNGDALNVVDLDENLRYFNILVTNTSESVIKLSNVKRILKINPKLGIKSSNISTVINSMFNKNIEGDIITNVNYQKIPDLDQSYLFADIDNVKMIEVSDDYPLNSAQGFYDPNNIANRWVLPRIDFRNSVIKMSSNSLK